MIKITETVLIVVPALLIFFDVWASFTPRATISEVTLLFFYQHPVAALCTGALFGHLTFPSQYARTHLINMIVVVAFLLIAVAVDRMQWLPHMLPVLPFVIGIPIGHLVWSQRVVDLDGHRVTIESGGTTLVTDKLQRHLEPTKPMPQ